MPPARIDQLTDAQRDCLRLVLAHHNSKEIAVILGVSPSAIDKRIERAVQILGVTTRFEAARLLHAHATRALAEPENPENDVSTSSSTAYERLPSEPIDVPNPAFPPAVLMANEPWGEPWGSVRRILGVSRESGSREVARNRLSKGDRLVRLIGLMGVIAITSMAIMNMAMTLTSLLKSNRPAAASIQRTQ